MKKILKILLIILCAMFLSVASSATKEENDNASIVISICAPSDSEQVIAQGRHFKVSGTIEGNISDDARVRVSLYDGKGNEVRYAESDKKGTSLVDTSWYEGQIIDLAGGTDIESIAYTMPEMVNPDGKTHDATVKCVYTDSSFYALITAATDKASGLVADDYLEFTDENGDPYTALKNGEYELKVTISEKDKTVAEASRKVIIGNTNGTVILRGGNNKARQMMTSWASDNNYTVLGDLLPGMFGPYYQMTAIPVSYMCEKAEYESGKIALINYNITESSTSYSLEFANFVQKRGIADSDETEYYVFDIGEPMIGEREAKITEVSGSKLYFAREDIVNESTDDGQFFTDQSNILSTYFDINENKTLSVTKGEQFALMGVTMPYQLADNEVEDDQERYGFCIYHNGVFYLEYTFKAEDGTENILTKDVGLKRIAEDGQTVTGESVYEFYHLFDSEEFSPGQYEVSVKGYDQKGQTIDNMEASFILTVADNLK